MSSIIQIKNTSLSGSVPTNLTQGELAINVTNGRLFYGSGSNNIVKEFPGSGNSIISASYLNPLTQSVFLTGSLNISGSETLTGYLQLMPVTTNINNSLSASYIYVSGSTNDLYFTQNGQGYANTTRLRWIEGNLYSGLLNGGIITTQSSTVYQVGSGSGLIVNLNASYETNPYPTVQYVNWGNLSASIAPLSASYDQSFIAINSSSVILAQGTPYTDGDYNTYIPLGVVVHQNRSTINAVQTFPNVAYGWKQRSQDFIRAFGPLKISGYTLSPSGSSTRGLVLAGGVAWVDGRNYTINPNNPSYISEAVGITTSKIYRYRQSGSGWAYDTNAGAGYTTIDPTQYSLNGTLTPVSTNHWTIQRVYYFPNSGTKAFYIYYGNAEYANQATALAAVSTETFSEAPNTAANALYIGYMLLRHNADFTTAASYVIQPAGLFRASGTGGGGGSGGTTTPGGSNTQIQYNNVGTFGGVPTLTYDGTTLTATGSFTGSFTGSLFGTASFANTASFVTNLNQAITIGNITSIPSNENTLNIYPPFPSTGTGEGGQILLAASGGLYTSASMLDTYQNYFRILKGTNIGGSTAQMAGLDLQTGNLSIAGALIPSAWNVGDVIQMKAFQPGDSGVYAINTAGTSTSNECFFSCSFTPKSTTSHIVVNMHAKYEPAGGGADDFYSTITINGPTGTEAGFSYQKFSASAGADRSGVLFPLLGRYTNSSTSTITICANVRRGTSDDNIAFDSGNSNSMTMTITEIGR